MKFFFFIYSCLIYLITPFLLLRLKWKSSKNAEYSKRINERFGFYGKVFEPIEHDVWIHAVSFGEVEVAQMLIRHWCDNGKRVLVTTTTPTGSSRVNELFAKKVTHVYLPFEWPGAIKRFLTFFSPKILVIIETELWPNLIRICSNHKLPIIITNARLSSKSVKGYAYISCLIKKTLMAVDLVLAQSAEDGDRFVTLGLDKTSLSVAGNLKFDAIDNVEVKDQVKVLREQLFSTRPIFIAASTHLGEEELILKAYLSFRQRYDNAVLILAPRHPERCQEIINKIEELKLSFICRTQNKNLSKEDSIFVLDTLGELQLFYKLSDIAFVGGSLVPHGGHNVLEPIRANIPVITGQHMHNFSFISEELLKIGGLVQVEDEAQLAKQLKRLFESDQERGSLVSAANGFLMAHKGALNKNIEAIEGFF